MQTQNLTQEQREQAQFIERMIQERTADTAAAASDYVPALLVSAEVSIGPEGANVKGYITYDAGNVVYFEFVTREHNGLFAGGGAHPCLVLPPERLRGKMGSLRAIGWGLSGELQMSVDGVRALKLPLLLAGLGLGYWNVQGNVRFR